MKSKDHFSENEFLKLKEFKLEEEINQKISKLMIYVKLEYYGEINKKINH
jgi:hypothetical protein